MVKYLLIILLISFSLCANAQNTNSLTSQLTTYHQNFSIEKSYLTFDKPYYNAGDTIWFKSYLLNGDLSSSTKTDKIHVELFNDSSRFITRRTIALNNGLGYGDFAIDKDLPTGSYTIRAYSNWQQNFNDTYFFQKSFYIGNVKENMWLLDSYQKLNEQDGKKTLDLKVRITNVKNEAIGFKDVDVYLMNDKKNLMRASLQTDQQGMLTTIIPLADEKINGNHHFRIVDKKDKSKEAILPIILQEVSEVDLQFMPEGGHMIKDVYGRVAFKAIGTDGLGKEISGTIVNSKNEQITEFSTVHKGMGSFFLLPQQDERYSAIYKLNGKTNKTILPIAKDEGTSLRINSLANKDTVVIYVRATPLYHQQDYQLLAQAANEVIMNIKLDLKLGFMTLKIPKNSFPDGIIHFTLLSPTQVPLNERQVFINRNLHINLQVDPNQTSYETRDSVSLELSAKNEKGLPLRGSFSISVTDDSKIKQKQEDENIISYFLLQSDLKGEIEDPSWYFSSNELVKWENLDLLMLSQAWVGYNWPQIMNPINTPKFKAEKDNLLEGSVTGLFNKPLPDIKLTLLSLGKNIFVTDTISNTEGRFVFKDLPLIDSAAYSIKIKNAKGKTSSGTILIDEFTPPEDRFSIKRKTPWYVNADTTILSYYKAEAKQLKEKETTNAALNGTMLKEVEVRSHAKLKAFNSTTAWDAAYFKEINEAELKKTPEKTLMDLLREKIEGFKVGTFWTDGCGGRAGTHKFQNYVIGSALISHILVDKLNTHLASSGINDTYNNSAEGKSITATDSSIFSVNTFILNNLKAADITNINVYKGCVYFFLDITTRSGKGPWIPNLKGTLVYRPLPIYVPKEFYSPKYTVNKNSTLPDLRSTLFWDANVVTDENGKVKLSFYTADKPSTYTIKIEGTDLNGRFGVIRKSIKILPKTESK